MFAYYMLKDKGYFKKGTIVMFTLTKSNLNWIGKQGEYWDLIEEEGDINTGDYVWEVDMDKKKLIKKDRPVEEVQDFTSPPEEENEEAPEEVTEPKPKDKKTEPKKEKVKGESNGNK